MATPLAGPLGKPGWLRRISLAGVLLAGFVGGLGACALPSAQVDLTGKINLFEPVPGFSLADLPDDWIAVGADPKGHAVIRPAVDGPSIRVLGGPAPYALLRRIDASLLATPFLSWSWRVEATGGAVHPARITIGLRDTLESAGRWRPPVGLGAGRGLPGFDRTMTLVWGDSALMRGSMGHITSDSAATRNQPASARYVVRGGRENSGRWWRETVDLSDIHAQAWPDLSRDESRLVFIGVTVTADPAAVSADFAGIRLSR